jgi:hypothetical protein
MTRQLTLYLTLKYPYRCVYVRIGRAPGERNAPNSVEMAMKAQ